MLFLLCLFNILFIHFFGSFFSFLNMFSSFFCWLSFLYLFFSNFFNWFRFLHMLLFCCFSLFNNDLFLRLFFWFLFLNWLPVFEYISLFWWIIPLDSLLLLKIVFGAANYDIITMRTSFNRSLFALINSTLTSFALNLRRMDWVGWLSLFGTPFPFFERWRLFERSGVVITINWFAEYECI